MNAEELKEICINHIKWLNNEDGGKRVDLREADLRGADLRGADLRGAYLRGAYLRGADLREADLREADLREADLRGADLRRAYLRGAYLRRADLREADLRGAYLREADLREADLELAKTIIVSEGDIIGYKKCRNNVIVKLMIPDMAKRSNATGRKCRAEYAEVLEIYGANEAISIYNETVIYKIGETIYPDKWDEDRLNECSNGIHFFITKIEAENYE